MVKFYTSVDDLKAKVAVSLSRCFLDFPAIGWVRGDIISDERNGEDIMEKYMDEHAMTKEDIDILFQKLLADESPNKENTIPDRVKAELEKLENKIPKIRMGSAPPESLEEGEIYLQYED